MKILLVSSLHYAHTLTSAIKDVLLRMNLSLTRIRGQCYDGASAMSGAKSGVAQRIKEEEPRALYTHSYGHSLNLAASDTIKASKLISNEIVKLIKYSPKRELIFKELKKECDVRFCHTWYKKFMPHTMDSSG